MTKAITLRLAPSDYDELEIEARRLGIAPATLARMYVKAALCGDAGAGKSAKYFAMREALRGFAELREHLPDNGPPPDVVQMIAEAREERARRFDR